MNPSKISIETLSPRLLEYIATMSLSNQDLLQCIKKATIAEEILKILRILPGYLGSNVKGIISFLYLAKGLLNKALT
jgi:hypothetical protein